MNKHLFVSFPPPLQGVDPRVLQPSQQVLQPSQQILHWTASGPLALLQAVFQATL